METFTIDVNQSFVGELPDIKVRKPVGLTSSNRGSSSYFDGFRRKRLPDDTTLVREYKRVAYTCANLNAGSVVRTPLKLYMKSTGNEKSLLRNGIETKSISSEQKQYLQNQPYLQKTLRSFVDIEEVVVHPILNILEKANSDFNLNGQRLFELTQLYQEVTGVAYWLVENDPIFNIPMNIWILPTQYVSPVKETKTAKTVDYYKYSPPGVSTEIRYNPIDIIPFRMPSLLDPYLDGLGPLEASFDANEVSNKLLSLEDGLLENEARPDAILGPKSAESALGADEAARYEKEYKQRFGRGRQGGVWVVQDDIQLTPLQFPPRDLARLEIHKWSKNDISNTFQVPYALIADSSHNRQQLEAAEAQHAKYGIKPRIDRNGCILNDLFVTRYDTTGRLFLAYDDPVPENNQDKLQENVQLGMNGFITPNEVRKNYNYPPDADAMSDKLRPINVSPEVMRQSSRDSGKDKVNKE